MSADNQQERPQSNSRQLLIRIAKSLILLVLFFVASIAGVYVGCLVTGAKFDEGDFRTALVVFVLGGAVILLAPRRRR